MKMAHRSHWSGGSSMRSQTLHYSHVFQRRSYYFLPTSWTEFRLRLQSVQTTTIPVQLLRDKWKDAARLQYGKAMSRYKQAMSSSRLYYKNVRSNALLRYQAQRQRMQTQRLQYKQQSLAFRQRWQSRTKRLKDKIFRTNYVTLTEYAESTWFDSVGRPLTSRDKTGRFVNPWQSQSTSGVQSLKDILRWRLQRFNREYSQYGWQVFLPSFWRTTKPPQSTIESMRRVASLPDWPVDVETIHQPVPPGQFRFTWIAHATCLLQDETTAILIDPMFSTRAGPYQSLPVGMARDVPLIIHEDNLPSIDICLITHDHYDHLDKGTVQRLRDRVQLWVVPLGLKDWLMDKGHMPHSRIVELEWWESVRLVQQRGGWKGVEYVTAQDRPIHPALMKSDRGLWVTCCPAQHWASRTFWDRNFRLWCSFAIYLPRGGNVYIGGDSALPTEFPLFEQMSDYLGPFDLAALPIGAYAPDFFMKEAHMNPTEAVKVHQILRCSKSIGIHWGSFPLSEEPLDEPPVLLQQAVEEAGVDFVTLPQGASLTVSVENEVEAEPSYETWIAD